MRSSADTGCGCARRRTCAGCSRTCSSRWATPDGRSTSPTSTRACRAIVAEAEVELSLVPEHDRTLQMEVSVIGTVAVERVLAAIRRMALEHASDERFGRRRSRRPGTP